MLEPNELVKTPEYWLDHIQNELYDHVSEYLKENKMSRQDFANQLNVSKGYVSQILNGGFNFTLLKLIELCLAINKAPEITFADINKRAEEISREAMIMQLLGTNSEMAKVRPITFDPSQTNIVQDEPYKTRLLAS